MDGLMRELNIKVGVDGQRLIANVIDKRDGKLIKTFYDDEVKMLMEILVKEDVKYKTIKVEGFMSCQKGI